ncbi:hepatic lectin-like [Saccostrea cucullata]|uniref:hepatic lectin-like n=1 Tax=Saccostrea cuccullata TaxID=36930 RepID=UPI002ED46529
MGRHWFPEKNVCAVFGIRQPIRNRSIDLSIKCEEQNSYLLALETNAEYEWLKTNLIDIQTNDIWLGGTDHVTEGRWTWIHNNSPWSVTYWAAGEPNDSKGTLNCAIQKQNDGLWYDRSCGEAHAYVCEHAQSNS